MTVAEIESGPPDRKWRDLTDGERRKIREDEWPGNTDASAADFWDRLSVDTRHAIYSGLHNRDGSQKREQQRVSAREDPDTTVAFNEQAFPEKPVPLPADTEPPLFPLEALPEPVRTMVAAVTDNLSVPADLAAVAALGVLSTAVTGAVEVQLRNDWREPANLYVVGVAGSGEGKSPMLKKFTTPLHDIERERQEEVRPAQIEAETDRELLETQRRAKVKAEMSADAHALAKTLDALVVPPTPRLMSNDATPEALVGLLAQNNGRLGVISDEGGDVFELTARYASTGKANLGIYLKGWDGSSFTEDRVSRAPRTIDKVTLAMVLMVQESVVKDVVGNPQFRDRGLVNRYLWVYPTSHVGERDVDTPAVPAAVTESWATLVSALAKKAAAFPSKPDEDARPPERVAIARLSEEAQAEFLAWRRRHEPKLKRGSGDLGGIADWGSKLPGQLGRLALILHVAKTGDLGGEIPLGTLLDAAALAEYFASHALRVYGVARLDERTAGARQALGWLRAQDDPLRTVTVRDIQRGCHFLKSDDARCALEVLADFGWVLELDAEPTGGAPRRPWLVHPDIYACQKFGDSSDTGNPSVPNVTASGGSEDSASPLREAALVPYPGPGLHSVPLDHATEVTNGDGHLGTGRVGSGAS